MLIWWRDREGTKRQRGEPRPEVLPPSRLSITTAGRVHGSHVVAILPSRAQTRCGDEGPGRALSLSAGPTVLRLAQPSLSRPSHVGTGPSTPQQQWRGRVPSVGSLNRRSFWVGRRKLQAGSTLDDADPDYAADRQLPPRPPFGKLEHNSAMFATGGHGKSEDTECNEGFACGPGSRTRVSREALHLQWQDG